MGMTLEKSKLYYDQAKHMMTLATAASAFAVTMYEKLSNSPVLKVCIPISLTLFCLSLVSLSFSMVGWASHNQNQDQADDETLKMFGLGLMCFCAGFTVLMIFVWGNFFN